MSERVRRILVVEGNTPELTARAASVGIPAAADRYAQVLQAIRPALETDVVRPSWPDFDLNGQDLSRIDGVAFTGSGVTWSAAAPEAAPHRAFMERVFAAGVPTLGSCYGLHLAAVVLGGEVAAAAAGVELGVARSLRLTEAGRAHPFMAGKPDLFDSVCIHRDEVSRLPAGARILASNRHTEVQAMSFEDGGVRFWGAQYHPELTLGHIADFLATPGRSAVLDRSKFEDDADVDRVVADFRSIGADADADGAAALRWRYGVSEDATHAHLRERELSNWLDAIWADAPRAPAQANSELAGLAPGDDARI